jgi:uncharacterized DUF497 family protein
MMPELDIAWDATKAQTNLAKHGVGFAQATVAHTYRPTGPASVHVRIISAREATRREREQYENEPR